PWIVGTDHLTDRQMQRLAPFWENAIRQSANASVIAWAATGLTTYYETAPIDGGNTVRLLDSLIAVIGKTDDLSALMAVGQLLSTFTARLDHETTIRFIGDLVTALAKSQSWRASSAFGTALKELAAKLDVKVANCLGNRLIEGIGTTANGPAPRAAGLGLGA